METATPLTVGQYVFVKIAIRMVLMPLWEGEIPCGPEGTVEAVQHPAQGAAQAVPTTVRASEAGYFPRSCKSAPSLQEEKNCRRDSSAASGMGM